jgi:acetylornithine deacetylase
MGRVARVDDGILEAVAAEAPAMTALLAELVAAPTLLGAEAAGQAVMRRAFEGLGLEPFDVPLDPAALERHPAGAPFGWDVAGKVNVLADWQPAAGDGRSLIVCGHVESSARSPRRCGPGTRTARTSPGSGCTGAARAT